MPGWVEVAMVGIFVRQYDGGKRPAKMELGIVPPNASLTFRSIELVDKVKGLGVISQGDEPVGKAFGNIHHPSVGSGQFGTKAVSESGRALAQIKDQIEERTREYTARAWSQPWVRVGNASHGGFPSPR